MWHARKAIVLCVLLTACGSVRLVEVQQSDMLFFGTGRVSGEPVSDGEWRLFVDEVITPRFPGFTEWSAEGHWKADRERTHVVQILHKRRGGEERKVAEIIAEYKRRFEQESVLWVRTEALATLE
ncbi:MAG TPA: DUF3574 domain-containing protein [Thermoanaerobaculia bacterium]|nr:DUF3574 domain-containing protein [Thermoanaerobaculia bacterium]